MIPLWGREILGTDEVALTGIPVNIVTYVVKCVLSVWVLVIIVLLQIIPNKYGNDYV